MKKTFLMSAVLAAALPVTAAHAAPAISFTKLWTRGHIGNQVSEVPAFDSRTNTLWVAGVMGVDVLDADTGSLVGHIDVTPHGFINGVAIHNGIAALAIEAAPDRRAPGRVLLYDTKPVSRAAT